MFKFIKDREQELLLLDFCVREAKYNKELIEELEKYPDEVKKNGQIHKGKQKARLKLIKDLKKENEKMKKFYIERKPEPKEGEHYPRYSYRTGVSERRHLYESN